MAPRIRPAQHLGGDAPCRVLEICAAAKNRRREARLFRAERQQFFCQARKRQVERGGLERGQEIIGARAPRLARGDRQTIAHVAWVKIRGTTLRYRVPRYLSCRTDSPAPPPDGALTRISVLAGTGQERACREHPERVEWQRSPLRPRQDTPRCSLEQFRRWPAPESRPRGTLRQAAQDLAARQMSLSTAWRTRGQKKDSPRHRSPRLAPLRENDRKHQQGNLSVRRGSQQAAWLPPAPNFFR